MHSIEPWLVLIFFGHWRMRETLFAAANVPHDLWSYCSLCLAISVKLFHSAHSAVFYLSIDISLQFESYQPSCCAWCTSPDGPKLNQYLYPDLTLDACVFPAAKNSSPLYQEFHGLSKSSSFALCQGNVSRSRSSAGRSCRPPLTTTH